MENKLIGELVNITIENWNSTYSFILFTGSLITFSSILTLTLCLNKNKDTYKEERFQDDEISLVRLLALEHSIGSISVDLQNIQQDLLKTHQFDIQQLREKIEKIEDCIIEDCIIEDCIIEDCTIESE